MKVKNHYDDHEVLHQQPVEDRRGAQRELTVYRVVKVDRDGEESLARCRNISDTGMKLDLRLPVVLNDELQIELAPGTVLSARVVWTNGEQCGVAFDQSVDCRTVLEDSSSELRSGRGRQPRVNAQLPARILSDGQVRPTTITNISQQGMLVTHDRSFRPGLRVTVMMDNGTERPAVVQWAHDNFAGLFLIDQFGVMELSGITAGQ